MKMDLIKIVGALSIGALALTGCKSGGDQPADAKSGSADSGCSPSGKSECKTGSKSECKTGAKSQ